MITFLLSCARIPAVVEGLLKDQVAHRERPRAPRTARDLAPMNGHRVSKMVHNNGIETDNMQLKKKEILH